MASNSYKKTINQLFFNVVQIHLFVNCLINFFS